MVNDDDILVQSICFKIMSTDITIRDYQCFKTIHIRSFVQLAIDQLVRLIKFENMVIVGFQRNMQLLELIFYF